MGKEYTPYAVIKLILGKIVPVGETTEDDKRLENLKETLDLVETLMADIRVVSSYSLNSQYSMKRAGELARKFLEELKEE